MRWMDVAWTQQGIAETAGAASTPAIVDYFRECGHPEVVTDETPWCAVFLGACLERAGIRSTRSMAAKSYEKFGTELPLEPPRVGAVAVLRFADGSQHVGFVAGATATTVALLGGNQKDAVNVTHFKLSTLVALRWPEPEADAKTLMQAGSRTVTAAVDQMRDAGKAAVTLASGIGASIATPDPKPAKAVIGRATDLMTDAASLEKFALFALSKWPYLAAALAAWFLARIAVKAGWIVEARVEDHNTGANPSRAGAQQAQG